MEQKSYKQRRINGNGGLDQEVHIPRKKQLYVTYFAFKYISKPKDSKLSVIYSLGKQLLLIYYTDQLVKLSKLALSNHPYSSTAVKQTLQKNKRKTLVLLNCGARKRQLEYRGHRFTRTTASRTRHQAAAVFQHTISHPHIFLGMYRDVERCLLKALQCKERPKTHECEEDRQCGTQADQSNAG